MHWYLIYTKPRQEKSALQNLEQQGYQCYLPLLPKEKLRQGALALTGEPLFPRYLFTNLAQTLPGSTTVRASRRGGQVFANLTWQMRMQRPTLGCAGFFDECGNGSIADVRTLLDMQLLELEFKLINLPHQLLGFATEQQALELIDKQHQTPDLFLILVAGLL